MKNENNFCETAGKTCSFNYCDENGCQDRKRIYTAFGLSLLNVRDLLLHLQEQPQGSEQALMTLMEVSSRFAALQAAPAWIPVAPDSMPEGMEDVLAWHKGTLGDWYGTAPHALVVRASYLRLRAHRYSHWMPLPQGPQS